MIDSALNLVDTTAQTVISDIQVPKLIATTEVSAAHVSTDTFRASASARFMAQVSFAESVTMSASARFAENVHVSGSARFGGNVSFGGTVNASGAATFNHTIAVSGSSTFVGPINASATSKFVGPVIVGSGRVLLTQMATVAHNNSAGNPVTFIVPPKSDLVEILVDTVETWNAGTLGTAGTIEVGVSASNRFFAVIPVSATGTRSLGSSFKTTTIKRWKNFSSLSGDATGNIRAHSTAASQQATAMTVGETILTIYYVQNI